jgi:hypothetical protein
MAGARALVNLRGVFPPITTPFNGAGIAFDKLTDNLRAWKAAGLTGDAHFPFHTPCYRLCGVGLEWRDAVVECGREGVLGAACE